LRCSKCKQTHHVNNGNFPFENPLKITIACSKTAMQKPQNEERKIVSKEQNYSC